MDNDFLYLEIQVNKEPIYSFDSNEHILFKSDPSIIQRTCSFLQDALTALSELQQSFISNIPSTE